MQRVKVFHVKAELTGKARKDLGENITHDVNAWLALNNHVTVKNISHSAETKSSYPEALVIITYEGEEKKPPVAEPAPAPTPAVPEPPADEPETPKSGRKPKR